MIGVRLEISKLITIFPEIRFHLDNFHLMALKEFLKTPEAASAYIITFGTESGFVRDLLAFEQFQWGKVSFDIGSISSKFN